MHEITDLRAPIQVHRLHTPSTTANIRVISRSESMPNTGGRTVKLRATSTPSKPIVNRRNTAPVVTSQHLAHRFRQNWLAKFPMDTYSNGAVNLDDSLTSLNWLQNLNIMKMASPSQPPVQQIMTPLTKDTKVNPNAILNVSTTPNIRLDQRLADTTRIVSPPVSTYDKIDYKSNHTVKPPYSYATLICMAMQETKKQKITLSAIYNWITENFMYYRMAEPSWQNSIRHNLSLNKCFQKVARRKDEPGKGGFWRINPEYVDSFENGIFKKRRCSRDSYTPLPTPPLKKIKREVEDDSYTTLQNSLSSKENSSNPFVNFNMVLSDDDSDAFSGDFNWSSILSQDISIDGKTLKTEDLLNETENLASPLMELSPPPSESNSDDLGLEELLSQTDFSQDVALDFTTNDPLDLTVSGTSLKAPDWWSENFAFADQKDLIEAAESATDHGTLNNSGLHTPIIQSPAYQNDGLSWDPNELSSAFDVDNLFDIDNLPDPHL